MILLLFYCFSLPASGHVLCGALRFVARLECHFDFEIVCIPDFFFSKRNPHNYTWLLTEKQENYKVY